MYKRLVILTVIIAAALGGLTVLGYHAIERWAESLKWKQFAEVAEQIRQDVEHKLDEFIQKEEQRPYTEYQYYYVPDNITNTTQQMALMRSPLGGQLKQGLAYGHFQIETNGSITTANDDIVQRDGENIYNYDIYAQAEQNRLNIKLNLMPVLNTAAAGSSYQDVDRDATDVASLAEQIEAAKKEERARRESQKKKAEKSIPFQRQAGKNFQIESLQRQERGAQVIEQQRLTIMGNAAANTILTQQQEAPAQILQPKLPREEEKTEGQRQTEEEMVAYKQMIETQPTSDIKKPQSIDEVSATRIQLTNSTDRRTRAQQITEQPQLTFLKATEGEKAAATDADKDLIIQEGLRSDEPLLGDAPQSEAANLKVESQRGQSETVQVRIEPFAPIVVGGGDAEKSIFGKQLFLVRDVQIEDRRFRQGFQLNEKKMIEEVKKSAVRFMRDCMTFELPQTKNERTENNDVAYTAVLDFGFGYLILYLKETVPEVVIEQASQLRKWYFSIVGVVLIAVTLALLSLWRYARAQIKLAEKKDDFISAVSHELRTPLTSIRMYSEMLENKWVKSEAKLAEYYRSMRQESERLSRLIENVLDFSRIQKGRKKYTFSVGSLNGCIAGVVEMMTPYAAQNGFSIRTELGQLGQTAFDNDAVKQIVVNLLDNAIKYARNAADKTITVRTKSDSQFILIEVEDHGPGVPHRQRKKIFEEFYRMGSEATRETNGTGLGLALVRKFAQAHNGFVEILTAKPAGTIFRVGLAMQS